MKKLKDCLIGLSKISLICLIFFVLSPSLKVQAMFNDTTNINTGIKLELGTVSLSTKDIRIVNAASFTEGAHILIASSKLVNDGSLSAKLAYKIDVKKENGSALTATELKDTSVIINFGTTEKEVTGASLNPDFTFVKDTDNKYLIIEPNKTKNLPVSISYKSNSTPLKEEKLTIKVTFKLIQSNASNANAEMFSDEETIKNTVTLVPEVVEEKSYWPDQSTFVKSGHGKYTYSLEKMKMLFSETNNVSNPNKRYIKNLNKAMLYIQLPENERVINKIDGNQMFMISQISTGNAAIKYESIELDEEHNGMIITFNLEDSYSYNPINLDASLAYANKDRYELSLNIEIQKYGMYNKGEYGYYDNSHTYDQFFATRLVLSSDLVVPINGLYTKYTQLPIKLTKDKILSFKKFNTTNPESADPKNFKDVQLVKENVELELTGDNSKYVKYSLISKNELSLWLNSDENIKDVGLNVKITGNTGHTLVISRKLENESKGQSVNTRSVQVPLVEEPTEQPIDTEINEEEPTSMTDSSLPNEQIPEVPIEEVVEVNPIDELVEAVEEKLIEGVDPNTVESNPELKEETITKVKSVQALPKEPISDE